MRFCEECGAQLEDDAKFCEECGAEQESLAIEAVQVQESIKVAEQEIIIENDSEYGFCEECGAKIKLTEKFCEECGTAIEQIKSITSNNAVQGITRGKPNLVEPETVAPVQVEEVPKQITVENEKLNTPVRKKRVSAIWVAIIIIVILAGIAGGYFVGKNIGTEEQENTLVADSMNNDDSIPETLTPTSEFVEQELVPTSEPTASSTPMPKPTSTPTPKPTTTATPTPKPTATATPIPKPTATPTPSPIISVFEGFLLGERESSVWKIETPDGIHLTLNDDPMARIGVIWDEGHRFDFSFDEIMVGSTDAEKIYTFYGAEGYMNPVNGHYDELQLSFTDDCVSIYWAYHFGQTVEVYYDNVVSMEYATCTSDYVSYGKQTMEVSDVTAEIQESDNLFQSVESGEIVWVDLYADMEDEISMRLQYNAEYWFTNIELYGYDEAVHMNGTITKEIHYDTEECYYIVPRFAEGPDFWGEPLQNLSEYDTYYEVKLNVLEEGIQLRWTLCEDDVEKVLYDGMIDVELVERRVEMRHY